MSGSSSVNVQNVTARNRKTNFRRICITATLYYSSIATGILDILISPTLIEFAKRLHTSVGVINAICSLSYITLLASVFVFGIVFTRVNRNIIVPPVLLVVALSIVTLPLTSNIPVFTVLLNVVLVARGAYMAAEMTWFNDLWKEKAGPFIQGQNFFKSLGHLITPLIFAPFLSSQNRLTYSPTGPSSDEITTETTLAEFGTAFTTEIPDNTTEPLLSIFEQSAEGEPNLLVPFEIIGALLAISALLQFLVYLCFDRNSSSLETSEVNEDKDIAQFCLKTFKKELPLVLFLTLGITGAAGWNFYTLNFLPVFAYFSSLHLSEMSAANLLSITNAVYSVGALAGIILNVRFNPRNILLGDIILIGLGNSLLLYAVLHGQQDLVQCSCVLLGLGLSTAVPSVVAYGQLNMTFNTVVGAVVLICSTLPVGILMVALGSIIEEFPNVLIYCNLAFLPVVLLSLFGFNFFVHRARRDEHGLD